MDYFPGQKSYQHTPSLKFQPDTISGNLIYDELRQIPSYLWESGKFEMGGRDKGELRLVQPLSLSFSCLSADNLHFDEVHWVYPFYPRKRSLQGSNSGQRENKIIAGSLQWFSHRFFHFPRLIDIGVENRYHLSLSRSISPSFQGCVVSHGTSFLISCHIHQWKTRLTRSLNLMVYVQPHSNTDGRKPGSAAFQIQALVSDGFL